MYVYSTARLAAACVAMVATLVVASGCGIRTNPSFAPRRDRSLITQDEAAYANAGSAYDIVDHLRPEFFIAPNNGSLAAERLVYVNGVRAGGLEVLHAIPAERVQEIRLLSAFDANRLLGGGHSAGALMIKLRRGWYPRSTAQLD